MFSSPTNDGTSTYTISTAVALRANQTWANNNTTNALAITGAVSGSGKNLTLAGAGGFTFSGANTYSGTTSLLSGTTLTLSGASGTLATSAISIEGGTTLNLDNTGGNNTDRIGNGAGITSRGGTIAPKGASATETVGTLTLSTGTTRVNVDAGSTASTALTLSGNGAATFNNAAQTAASLPSPANGVLTLNGTAFIVTAPTTFDGKFTG